MSIEIEGLTILDKKLHVNYFQTESNESKEEGGKWYQLRNAITHPIKAANSTFITGREMTFDEGGDLIRLQLSTVTKHQQQTS